MGFSGWGRDPVEPDPDDHKFTDEQRRILEKINVLKEIPFEGKLVNDKLVMTTKEPIEHSDQSMNVRLTFDFNEQGKTLFKDERQFNNDKWMTLDSSTLK